MDEKYDILIIGAGTAGISAFKEASKKTDRVLLIDRGPLGTTCARVGCMPSKIFIHSANICYEKQHFKTLGINGAVDISANVPAILKRVRKLRDEFTGGVIQYIESIGDQFQLGEARFCDENTVFVNDTKIQADKVIIATGSKNIIPDKWGEFNHLLLTSDDFFEQKDIPNKMAVIGGGVIGLELGQAMARLGVQVKLFNADEFVGGITDPSVNEVAINIFKNEFDLYTNTEVDLEELNDQLKVIAGKQRCLVDKALVSIGRAPNLSALDPEKAGIFLEKNKIPEFDCETLKLKDKAIYLVGDVNKTRPLLHEAADEGRIAGFNASQSSHDITCFERRAKLSVVFTQPNIISVGDRYQNLPKGNFVIGEVSFENQGRSRIMCQNQGVLRVYVEKGSGHFLGAEGIVPDGEHIAHLLAWALQMSMTAYEILQMPFYHPVVEEGMRTALRNAARKLKNKKDLTELVPCNSEAVDGLS